MEILSLHNIAATLSLIIQQARTDERERIVRLIESCRKNWHGDADAFYHNQFLNKLIAAIRTSGEGAGPTYQACNSDPGE